MSEASNPIEALVELFAKLPGIGPKGARRQVFNILDKGESYHRQLSDNLLALKDAIQQCRECGNVATSDLCAICSNDSRDREILCIVEQPKDLQAIEKGAFFSGYYHVLGGVIDPTKGMTPSKLNLQTLVERANHPDVSEVLIATSPSIEGDATAFYIQGLLKDVEGVQVTRIASGVPMGTELEFADKATLARAFQGRSTL